VGSGGKPREIARTDTRESVQAALQKFADLVHPRSTKAAGNTLLASVRDKARHASFETDLAELKHYARLWGESRVWIRACSETRDKNIDLSGVWLGGLALDDETLVRYTHLLVEGKLPRQEQKLQEFCAAQTVKGTLQGQNLRIVNLDYRHTPKTTSREEERDARKAITQLIADLEVCLNKAGDDTGKAAKQIRKEIERTEALKVALTGPLAIFANLVVFALFQGEWNTERRPSRL